jgi:hypothetical protein
MSARQDAQDNTAPIRRLSCASKSARSHTFRKTMYALKTAPSVTPIQSLKSVSQQSAHLGITFKRAPKSVSENANLSTSMTPTKLASPHVP